MASASPREESPSATYSSHGIRSTGGGPAAYHTSTTTTMFLRSSRFSSPLRHLAKLPKRHLVTGTTTSTTTSGRALATTARVTSTGTRHTRHLPGPVASLWVRGLATTTGTTTTTKRGKASLAALEDSDDDDQVLESAILWNHPSQGHAAAAAATVSSTRTHDEAWMINLGRNDDNAWLSKPREATWWTGVHPLDCPGTDEKGIIRSLPLPNLSAVTRQSAKDYFDNSWTLYETLFAGLKGEEGSIGMFCSGYGINVYIPFGGAMLPPPRAEIHQITHPLRVDNHNSPPPHGLRHPQIFYYGHTACLYVNKLRVAGVISKPVNAYFESIFEVGVDEMLWDDMNKNDMLWPTVSEVHQYRQQVYKTVVDAIENHPSLEGGSEGGGGVLVDQSHPMWALFMGFEHERIHSETSSVLFRETPFHLVQAPKHWPPIHPSGHQKTPTTRPKEGVDYPPNRMIAVRDEGRVDLGKPANFPSFGWDNEYGERQVSVPPFQASEHMVTNGEFWEFVADGGYRKQEYWCDDGWAWRTHRNMKWPFFWEPAGPAGSHEYHLRTIFDLVSMPWSWPVDVNYYEAKAFCHWKTAKEGSPTSNPYRILTEAEHHVIRHQEHSLDSARKDIAADKVMVTSGKDFAEGSTGANINLSFSSQNPVDVFSPSHTGHKDTTGNAWEWTEDHFNPLKGFEVHHVYDDFSTPCFDGKHSMIVGGSFISTGDEASVFARFHFRPHFLQHSGFRLVASDHDAPATHLFAGNFEGQAAARDAAVIKERKDRRDNEPDTENVYETDDSVNMYLGLHFPSSGQEENVPPILPHSGEPRHGLGFPQRVARLLKSLKPEYTNNRALDIGCAVGGSSFELARTFDCVDAFDFSRAFIDTARRMQDGEDVRYKVPIEAELHEEVKAVHEQGVDELVRSKIHFFTGDACRMGEMASHGLLGTYDGAVMSNLLCRLPDPMACLNDLPTVMNKGGVIVMVTPFSWLTQFTPRAKWLGGFQDPVTKEPIYSKDVLRDVMESNGFEKIHEEEMPLVIREHRRKYQYIISEATGWRKIH